jgi:hypothetical protein
MAWADVGEVVEARYENATSPFRVSLVSPITKLVVAPMNVRRRDKLFQELLEAASAHGIAVRTDWRVSGGDS